MAFLSSLEMMCCAASIVAWAILPATSSLYIRESKEIEDVKSSTALSVPLVNRPPQSFAIILNLLSLSLMH